MPCALASGLDGDKLQVTIVCCRYAKNRTSCEGCQDNPYALPPIPPKEKKGQLKLDG